METIAFWLKNARCSALVQSLLPAVTAAVLSVGGADFSLGMTMLAVAGVGFAHLAFNLLDDFFDYISHQTGYRNTLVRSGARAYLGKCLYLTKGGATLSQLAAACAVFGVLAVGCGAVIFLFRGWPALWVAAATAFLGYFYSGKPLRLSYHGLGEPVIGIIFGPLNAAGVALSAAGRITWEVILVGTAMGFLVANILYTHSVLDYAADQSVGKHTLAACFPTRKARKMVSAVFIFFPGLLILAGIVSGRLSLWYLLVFFSFPFARELYQSLSRFMEEPETDVVWKWWYGPAGRFYAGRKLGLDWFLQRWLLARNLTAVAALCCMAASIFSKAGFL